MTATTTNNHQTIAGEGYTLQITSSSVPDVTERFGITQPKFQGRIRTFARRNFRSLPGFAQQDLENEILEVLWLACLKYNPNNGSGFTNFFWTCAERRFLDLHKAASRKMRVGDYETDVYDPEMMAEAIREFADSAEDEALARIHVKEIYRSQS